MRKAEKTEKIFLVETTSVAEHEAGGGPCHGDLGRRLACSRLHLREQFERRLAMEARN